VSPTAETAALIQLSLRRPGKSAIILTTETILTVPPSGTVPPCAHVHPIDNRTFILLCFSRLCFCSKAHRQWEPHSGTISWQHGDDHVWWVWKRSYSRHHWVQLIHCFLEYHLCQSGGSWETWVWVQAGSCSYLISPPLSSWFPEPIKMWLRASLNEQIQLIQNSSSAPRPSKLPTDSI